VTLVSAVQICIRSTEDGYYHWQLCSVPDGAFQYAGTAPLLERCFEEIIRAQWSLADSLTSNPHPEPGRHSHDTLDPAPITQVQTPPGNALPAQQDIPATPHTTEPFPFIYPPPSKSG